MSDYSRRQEITLVWGDWLVERDGFEPEISLVVLPSTQSQTPVPVSAVHAAKLPMDGSVEGNHRLAGWTNSWRSRTPGQLSVNRWQTKRESGAKGTPWLVTRRTAGVDVNRTLRDRGGAEVGVGAMQLFALNI
jgi:hypothetical protein